MRLQFSFCSSLASGAMADSPFTVAGPHRILTGFPFHPSKAHLPTFSTDTCIFAIFIFHKKYSP
jgi:hypothetical protein